MNELNEKIDAIIKLNGQGHEYEESFRVCKRYSKAMTDAILGQSDKKAIENAIIEMQSSLEIIKFLNKTNTETVNKGVLDTFGIKPKAEVLIEPKVGTPIKPITPKRVNRR